jgi:hypothetical protein
MHYEKEKKVCKLLFAGQKVVSRKKQPQKFVSKDENSQKITS